MSIELTNVVAVVIDIEGTTSSTWYVYEHLYPYSRARFAEIISQRDSNPVVARAMLQVGELLGEKVPDEALVLAALNDWLEHDEKVTPLKLLQGEIWNEGFATGELTAHFYPDAIPEMRRWKRQGLSLFVFSSGSLAAQDAWFGYSPEGDLRPLLDGNFDTENAGPKRDPASYRIISQEIGVSASQIVFLSDLDAELDAARSAGWQTVCIRREGEQHSERGAHGHPEASCFTEVNLLIGPGNE